MSRRTAEANKAIAVAWQKEQELVRKGKGTRDWTQEQQQDILGRGKAYDDDGRAFEGQHMKSVEQYPECQGDPSNIQFLTKKEHLDAHMGNWQNPTNWYYDPLTQQFFDFGNGKHILCKTIELSNPVAILRNTTIELPMKDDDVNTRQGPFSKSINSANTANRTSSVPIVPKVNGHKSVMAGVKETAKKIWDEYGDDIIRGTVMFFAAIAPKIIESLVSAHDNSEKKSRLDNSQDDVLDDNKSHQYFEDNIESTERNSPREHMVKTHAQRYGKDKVWKEKDAYPRGGKKND